MEEIWSGEEEEVQFGLREVVWAKIIGYPWWPARVTLCPNGHSANYRVDFFNDNTHAYLPSHKICPYEDMRSTFEMHRQINKGLRKAVGSADKAFGEQGASRSVPDCPLPPVEEPFLKQKQLLKSPQPLTTLLQEHNKHSSGTEVIFQQSISESEFEQQHEDTPPPPKYTREQRERYVDTLLKKYRLTNIPKIADNSVGTKVPRPAVNRRKTVSRKPQDAKTKVITKQPFQPQSFFYLLTRKIHSLLKQKEGLQATQRRQISSSLAKEVLNGGSGVEEVGAVLKWVMISGSNTIANYYQNWGCMQGDKQKSSNMTTQE